ncbi:hypothetical protein FY112_05010 [Rhizobium sp. PEPV16]|nr:hypothetical protein FY112_05010 [Rhizobium sp. PEPV16]
MNPATPYPEDYQATVAQAAAETAPPVIRSFLLAHDLTGRSVVPFVTHGGYGLGNSMGVVEAHAPEATVRRGFSLAADQEKRTLETVSAWLDALPPTD